jgi:hypothetical protein
MASSGSFFLARSQLVGVEVGYRVIPFVPVHVDHHTVEGADPWHATTIAEVQASTGQVTSDGSSEYAAIHL